MGTSGVVFAHADELGFDPLGRLQRGCHAVPGAWHVMGVVLAAGGSFQWFRNELGKAEVDAAKAQGVDPYFLLTDEAALAGVGAEGLFFLPYLTGERTPHFDPDAKGAWIGLTVRHGRPHLIRSVLEGATYAMRDSLELIREMGVDDRADPRLRRRRPEPALAADPGRHLRPRRPHAELDRGPGLRRRPAGPGRHRRLLHRPRGVRRHDPPGRADAGRPQGQGVLRPRLRALSPALPGPHAARSPRSARWSRRLEADSGSRTRHRASRRGSPSRSKRVRPSPAACHEAPPSEPDTAADRAGGSGRRSGPGRGLTLAVAARCSRST